VDERDLTAVFEELHSHGRPPHQLTPDAVVAAGRRARHRRTALATGLATTAVAAVAAVPVLLGLVPTAGGPPAPGPGVPPASGGPSGAGTPPQCYKILNDLHPPSDPRLRHACTPPGYVWCYRPMTPLPNDQRPPLEPCVRKTGLPHPEHS
jgi:hypothetical protein